MSSAERPALFWDFHGTLTLPDVTWFKVALEAAEEQAPGHPLDPEALIGNLTANCLPWFTVPSRDTRHLAGSGPWWAHTEKEFAGLYERCGLPPADAARAAARVREKSLEPHRYVLYADAAATLEELGRRGYKNYVLSNNFPELPGLVAQLGLGGCFRQVFTSGLIGYDKPRREIFDHARAAAGGRECWMIGDNPADDIEGGRAAGFVTVAVHGVASGAHHTIDALAELLELLP